MERISSVLVTNYCNALKQKTSLYVQRGFLFGVEICLYRAFQIGDYVPMKYWLLKSEPASFSIEDLKKRGTDMWDGVRNYQARNYMQNDMKKGDRALFYHSSAAFIGIVGLAEIVSTEAYLDPTQFDPKDDHYDPKATKNKPRWFVVDVRFKKKFRKPVALAELKNDPFFNDMPLTQRGMRLSVQPVARKHYERILAMTA